jgi:hypothetical protein
MVMDAHTVHPYQVNLPYSPGRMNTMDPAASEVLTDNSRIAHQRVEQIALEKAEKAEIKKLRGIASRKQVDLVGELAAQGHDYSSIEKYLNENDVCVNSVLRQEIWLAINHEHLSQLLREHYSDVRHPVVSDPATLKNPCLDLTPEVLVHMQNEMSRRLKEVEQFMEGQYSEVQWGEKLRKHAKWEYLRDEIVPLYTWLKQQDKIPRGMNMVRSEMTRRYGKLFEFR